MSTPPFGLYIHIPFCTHRCDYCAFATWTGKERLFEPYVAACRTELARAQLPGGSVTSVFVGGGTPSLLPADLLVGLLSEVPCAPGAEITVEANPGTVDLAKARAWRAGGVSRVSLGVQSARPHVLEGLGRRQDPASVEASVCALRQGGFQELNLDLVYGGAGESDEDWQESLDMVVRLGAPHVSAYALTVEPGTPLARDPARHPDDDVQARRYEMAERALSAAGLRWYEISNWARPGSECRHNQLYWSQGDYLGIGASAHSHRRGRRWWNVASIERYVARIEAGMSATGGEEQLDEPTRAFERLALALRTRAGVPAEAFGDRALEPELEDLLVRRDGRAVLSVRGRLLANEVTLRLVDSG